MKERKRERKKERERERERERGERIHNDGENDKEIVSCILSDTCTVVE